jgi:cobalt-zinc-cadmium efflux system outer membrane protein
VLLVVAGCRVPEIAAPARIEPPVAAALPARAKLGFEACAAPPAGNADGPLDLVALWRLAADNNPSLREAAAEVDAARGQQIQSSKYPNPHFHYDQDTIGSRVAPPGNMTLLMTQEIVTGGKRRLDMAMAGRDTDAAVLALLSRRYEVMTRLRRAYYAYLGALYAHQLNGAAVASLEKGVATTRDLVKISQRRSDLLRLEALLEETKINQARSAYNVEAAWKQVTAEVGLAELPMPHATRDYGLVPAWDGGDVWQRVKAANSGLQRASTEADRARLAVERARAEAIPNFTVGGGYINAPIETTAGAIVSFETPIPVWDCKQGHIREVQARWAKAQAAVRTLETTLSATTAELFARYQGAQRQVEKLDREVLPRLQESLDLMLKTYEVGGAGVSFTDVLMTEQSLITMRLTLAEARQTLWQAIADLQGLMQVDIGEE